MRWNIIRQHQHRRLAVPDEVARHAVEEIGPTAYKSCRYFSIASADTSGRRFMKVGYPVFRAMPIHDGRIFRPVANGLAEHHTNDAVRRPLH